MVFRKPYAFLIKNFKVINLLLSFLLFMLLLKLNNIHNVINDLYHGISVDIDKLISNYLNIPLFLLVLIIFVILGFIIVLLKKKDKPFGDYLYNIFYFVILIIYFIYIFKMFTTLQTITLEPSEMLLYNDISLWVIAPLLYFIVKFILIAVGFSYKKFNFTKDIIELKAEETDNEEVELVIPKDTYKYKRGVRKQIRELKYYVLENKMFVYIILGIFGLFLLSSMFGLKLFNKEKVKLNQNFVAGTFSYKINSVIETTVDLNNNEIDKDSKYVIANVTANNLMGESLSINYNNIRLVYGDEFSYASNYYNKHFKDIGVPYDNQLLESGKPYNYLIIFKVPRTYKSNKYIMKFYDRNTYNEEEGLSATYKELKFKSEKLNDKITKKINNFNTIIELDKKRYGTTTINIKSFDIKPFYKYESDGLIKTIKSKSSNDMLLIVEYDLDFDKDNYLFGSINEKYFFSNFIKLTYTVDKYKKNYTNVKVVDIGIDNRVFLSVPYNFKNNKDKQFVIKFRGIEHIYNIK